MIYVVAEELIPEAKNSSNDHSDIPTIGVMLGFAIYDALRCGVRLIRLIKV